MEARIITLSPSSNISRVATFEEAFGDFSEAGGRGRARRQKRRLERIENRAERRSARRKSRAEAQSERQSMRSERQASRQARHMQRKSARLERRMAGAEAREERRKLRNPDEKIAEESNLPPVDNQQGGGGYADQQGGTGFAEQQGGAGYAEQHGVGGYAEQQGGGYSSGGNFGEFAEDSQQSGQNYQDDDGGYEGDGNNAGNETEEEGSESENDSTYGFDGIISAEDRFDDVEGEDNIQRISVPKAVQDMADKYEWNKEMACRLILKRNDAKNSNMPTQGLTDQIEERKKRMDVIKSHFDNYLNFDAEFSECCGYSNADGNIKLKKANHKLKKKRLKELKTALQNSKDNRISVKGGSAIDRMRKLNKIRHYGGDVVPVEESLNPEISENSIVIPEKKSNYTGLNAIDNANDYDAPPTREVYLNADGEGQGALIGVGSILLGVGLTIGILYLADKYKMLK